MGPVVAICNIWTPGVGGAGIAYLRRISLSQAFGLSHICFGADSSDVDVPCEGTRWDNCRSLVMVTVRGGETCSVCHLNIIIGRGTYTGYRLPILFLGGRILSGSSF